MGILTKEQIEAVEDLTAQIVKVDVPEWGGTVCLRPMTVGELDAYSNEAMRKRESGVDDFRSKLLAYCLCDEHGKRLFTNGDIAKLAERNGPVMARLYDIADKLNDIGPKAVEDLAGKSGSGQTPSSDSVSPGTSSEPSPRSTDSPSPSSGTGEPSTGT